MTTLLMSISWALLPAQVAVSIRLVLIRLARRYPILCCWLIITALRMGYVYATVETPAEYLAALQWWAPVGRFLSFLLVAEAWHHCSRRYPGLDWLAAAAFALFGVATLVIILLAAQIPIPLAPGPAVLFSFIRQHYMAACALMVGFGLWGSRRFPGELPANTAAHCWTLMLLFAGSAAAALFTRIDQSYWTVVAAQVTIRAVSAWVLWRWWRLGWKGEEFAPIPDYGEGESGRMLRRFVARLRKM